MKIKNIMFLIIIVLCIVISFTACTKLNKSKLVERVNTNITALDNSITCFSSANTDNADITAVIVLQKGEFFGIWHDIGEIARLENQFRTISLSGTIDDLDSGTYRSKTTFTVVKDDISEKLPFYSTEKKIE